jgi:hypothetical protein
MRIAVVMLGSFDLKLRGFLAAVVLATSLGSLGRQAQGASPALKVIAFYTGMKDEPAHISFVQEANRWFAEAVRQSNFKELSLTFANETQNRLILDGLLWLGAGKK